MHSRFQQRLVADTAPYGLALATCVVEACLCRLKASCIQSRRGECTLKGYVATLVSAFEYPSCTRVRETSPCLSVCELRDPRTRSDGVTTAGACSRSIREQIEFAACLGVVPRAVAAVIQILDLDVTEIPGVSSSVRFWGGGENSPSRRVVPGACVSRVDTQRHCLILCPYMGVWIETHGHEICIVDVHGSRVDIVG